MFSRNLLVFVSLALALAVGALSKDFVLLNLPAPLDDDATFDLQNVAGQKSYYEYMQTTLGKKILELAPEAHSGRENERDLHAGRGVRVKLGESNYNIHINFPAEKTGGRSYGWTSGQVGDWSDRMYLESLEKVVAQDEKLGDFYKLIIQMLGASNANGIEDLPLLSQRVASNFLAIYTAEQYRGMVDSSVDWDDALLQVTLVAAFHGGQKKLTKFYAGEFKTTSKEQDSGVYAPLRRGKWGKAPLPGKIKNQAELNDYWQFSAKIDSKQSGINLTRGDFELMGKAITTYEDSVGKNAGLIDEIQKIVDPRGKMDDNVIKAIADFFTEGKSKDIGKINALADLVSRFLLAVRGHAGDITTWKLNGGRLRN